MQAHLSAMPLLLAPLTRGNMAIGVFGVMGKTLTQADLPAVMLFARQVSVALENARLFAAEQARRIELGASYNLANSLVATDSLNETHWTTHSRRRACAQPRTFRRRKTPSRARHWRPSGERHSSRPVAYANATRCHPTCQRVRCDD